MKRVISLPRARERVWNCSVVVGSKGDELITRQSHSVASENT